MSVLFRKTKQVLNFLEEKPEVFRLQQVTFPAVTFDQLVKECSLSCGVNTSQTRAVIDALVDRIVHYMEIGHGVKMGDFGSFKPVFNSKVSTKLEKLSADNITKKKVRFYAGKAFRNMLSDLSVNSASEVLDDVPE